MSGLHVPVCLSDKTLAQATGLPIDFSDSTLAPNQFFLPVQPA